MAIVVLIFFLVIGSALGYHIYQRRKNSILEDRLTMDLDETTAKQVLFLPTQCQEEVEGLIEKFTSMESNLDLNELKSLVDNNANADRLSNAIKGLKQHIVLPEVQELRELSVEAYVVEIEGTMRDYVKVIVNASQQGHDAVSKTEELLKQIDSIFSLVDGLRHIADQTGLLALNAAIEAAKSGNVGRTYSYMAKEVQRLSAQSENFGGDIKTEMQKAKNSVQATSAMVDQMVVSDLHIALETRSGVDQLIGQLQGLALLESAGIVNTEAYGKIIGEMHKIVVVVLMKVDLIQRLGLVDKQFLEHLNNLNERLVSLYQTKVVKQ